jgi:hypothetical protein
MRKGVDRYIYQVWVEMRSRCCNPRHVQFYKYGGRGIYVCKRWEDYLTFAADMGPRPTKGYWSIERKNNNKGYSPHNCKWATRTEQNRNQRRNKLTLNDAKDIRQKYVRGVVKQIDLAKEYDVPQATISCIVLNITWKGR